MMISRRTVLSTLSASALLAACGRRRQVYRYDGPEVTSIVLNKSKRRLFLLHNEQTLKDFPVELGSEPEGHKQQRGDGRTPEGLYYIDRRNPNSEYFLSIGISYPAPHDHARAREAGVNPGGDIFIHGTTAPFVGKPDWTAGCIAVSNEHMIEIFTMVKLGTPILITP
ncbi:MAG: hypothetical protein CSA72_05400 [Rhodobacterales bacterium]|nr:MAG: hypothetical protein CSA72_05400 [Rhodobacterales bacterium]